MHSLEDFEALNAKKMSKKGKSREKIIFRNPTLEAEESTDKKMNNIILLPSLHNKIRNSECIADRSTPKTGKWNNKGWNNYIKQIKKNKVQEDKEDKENSLNIYFQLKEIPKK